jgi:hypothetical protein
MKRKLFAALSIAAFAVLGVAGPATLAGCEATDEIDEVVDCTKICNRYDECVDDEYDVDGCIDECEDKADNEEGFEEQADECESCIDSGSCTENVFNCIDECAGIVP